MSSRQDTPTTVRLKNRIRAECERVAKNQKITLSKVINNALASFLGMLDEIEK